MFHFELKMDANRRGNTRYDSRQRLAVQGSDAVRRSPAASHTAPGRTQSDRVRVSTKWAGAPGVRSEAQGQRPRDQLSCGATQHVECGPTRSAMLFLAQRPSGRCCRAPARPRYLSVRTERQARSSRKMSRKVVARHEGRRQPSSSDRLRLPARLRVFVPLGYVGR